MLKWTQQLRMLVAQVALAGSAWSQAGHYTVPAASVGDDFAAYRQALDSAADLALANVMREAAASSQIADVAAKTGAPQDANALHQFAAQYWNGNDEGVRRAVARVTQLKPLLASILREQGVPDEAVALVLVESGGRETAFSPKGARGIWQLMPDTARRYGLTVNSETDDRLDVEKSTRAAARYLHDLQIRFGSWSLALAAYNAGENLVEKAVFTAGSKDFALLSSRQLIPTETRSYVPAVLAASNWFAFDHPLGSGAGQTRGAPAVLYANSAAGGQE